MGVSGRLLSCKQDKGQFDHMSRVLVLNMGMKSIRSIIFDESGEKLDSYALPLTTQLNEEQVMQDPNEWWEKARIVVRASLKNRIGQPIDYITITASSSCLVYVDNSGNALDRCIMVSDKRARAEAEEIRQCPAFSKVLEKTGLEMDACLMLPKILWVKNHQPDKFAKTAKFLSPNDFLIWKITGHYVTDSMNAQKYHYDLKENDYPKELLQSLGIPREKLPEVQEPGTLIGEISRQAAEELGICGKAKVVKVLMTQYVLSLEAGRPGKEKQATLPEQ